MELVRTTLTGAVFVIITFTIVAADIKLIRSDEFLRFTGDLRGFTKEINIEQHPCRN